MINEKGIGMLEKELIEMGEDATFLSQLRKTYVEEHGKPIGTNKYYSHLLEITKKYYGGVQ
jgi:hypothetical protein